MEERRGGQVSLAHTLNDGIRQKIALLKRRMGKEEILITCPWCGGQKIIDDLALGYTINGIKKPIVEPEDLILFDFICLECGEGFTTQDKMKDISSEKDFPEDS